MAKTVFSPVRSLTDPPVYFLIDCSPNGFATLKFIFVDGASTPTWRTVSITSACQSLTQAKAAFDKAVSCATLEVGELPPSTPYADATVISASEAEEFEAQRAAAVAVAAVHDPRKALNDKRRGDKRTREQRELASGFMIAFRDTTAIWSESRADAYRFVKGPELDLKPVDSRTCGMTSEQRAEKAKTLAYELGGAFSLLGFFDEHGVFVITSPTAHDEALERRINRARPGHVRRARHYGSPDERAAAVRAMLDGATASILHIACHHRNAIRYADTCVDRNKLNDILPLLSPDERRTFDALSRASL